MEDKLIYTDDDIILVERLSNGLGRYRLRITDSGFIGEGGGSWMKYPLIDVIKRHGQKQIYNNCYEWCSGSAPIGFSILDLKIAKKLTCNDSSNIAIENCKITALKNNIEHKVNAFLTSSVSQIPDGELWDLVVGNPPHVFEKTPEIENDPCLHKILLDEDKQTHKEFYSNIRPRLTEDAEVFIIESENARNPMLPEDDDTYHNWDFKIMADEAGLELIDVHKFTIDDTVKLGAKKYVTAEFQSTMKNHKFWVMHFKVKKT